MATATASEALQERIEGARQLHWELTAASKRLEEVTAAILARCEPDDIRRKFRACQSAMMSVGRVLLLDGRFRPRLPNELRARALELLRSGARPVELQRKLGLDSNTIRRMRYRELGDTRNLNRLCKLSAEQVAEIRAAGRATLRRHFAAKFNVSMALISKVRNSRGSYREVTKVSPIQSIQQTAIAKPPWRPKMNGLILRLNAPVLQTLTQMSTLAHCEIAAYASQLIEAAAADFRLKQIPSDFLVRADKVPDPPPANDGNARPPRRGGGKFSSEEREKIAEQRDEGMSVIQLAERWHCGATTIRRTLKCE
jgi:hypothetical protein